MAKDNQHPSWENSTQILTKGPRLSVSYGPDVGIRVPKALFSKILILIYKKVPFQYKIVELILLRSDEMKTLNRKFRSKNKTTDVLSFPIRKNQILGSIAIDLDTAKLQAQKYGHPLKRELQELFIHGMLHLLGFDHEREQDAKVMTRAEKYFISKL